jgi:glycosyltransferase involved in cell wall biosynthesis
MDSLLTQDYQPLEIIVYDGGSTDGTIEILRTYPVEVIVERGLGQMAAINRGWQRTAADFVTWWAGDDRYKPGAIRRLATELAKHPDAGFVHGEADIIDEHGKVTRHLYARPIELKDLAIRFAVVPQSALIRKSALRNSGMMDERRRLAADWDLFLRLAQYFPSYYVPFTASECRLHAGSQDAQNLDKLGAACIDVMDSFFRRADLSEEQRELRKFGVAGSRISAGWYSCVAGDRRLGWKLFFEAISSAPSVFFTNPGAVRLLGRLLLPMLKQRHWQLVNTLLGRVNLSTAVRKELL